MYSLGSSVKVRMTSNKLECFIQLFKSCFSQEKGQYFFLYLCTLSGNKLQFLRSTSEKSPWKHEGWWTNFRTKMLTLYSWLNKSYITCSSYHTVVHHCNTLLKLLKIFCWYLLLTTLVAMKKKAEKGKAKIQWQHN